MRKLIIISILLTLVACGKSSKNTNPDKKEEFFLEGTVVKIFNYLIPSAHAANLALLSEGKNPECEGYDRCAFLVESEIGEKVVARTPVINSKFKFKLDKPLNPELLYKVIVRGWNPTTKMALSDNSSREIVFLGKEINGSIEVNPESTVTSIRREEILKQNKNIEEADLSSQSILSSILNLLKEGTESVRFVLLKVMNSLPEEVSELLFKVSAGSNKDSIKGEIDLRFLRSQKWNLEKVIQSSGLEVVKFYQDIINSKKKLYKAQSAYMNDYGLRQIISINESVDYEATQNLATAINNKRIELSELTDEASILAKSAEIANIENELEIREKILILKHENSGLICTRFFIYNDTRQNIEELQLLESLLFTEGTPNRNDISNQLLSIKAQDIPEPNDFSIEEYNQIKQYCDIQIEVR